MKLIKSTGLRSSWLRPGVENLAEFPVLLKVQEIDFAGMVAISSGVDFYNLVRKGQRSAPGEIPNSFIHRRRASDGPLLRSNQRACFGRSEIKTVVSVGAWCRRASVSFLASLLVHSRAGSDEDD
jgi:hypothetical protein